jgi:DNA-directed RNA polymerase specialized sigma24 family protein
VRRVHWLGERARDGREYASKEEFVCVFTAERTALERLALLLAANSEGANRCLDLALQECIPSSLVFKGWVLTWIRRVVIRNAIELVKSCCGFERWSRWRIPDSQAAEPRGSGRRPFIDSIGDAERELIVSSDEDSLEPIARSSAILHLPELDRLVFVICVLERYSIQDCALLLGRSPGDVSETRRRAANQVEQIGEIGRSLRLAMC